jgi:hypothetical protein
LTAAAHLNCGLLQLCGVYDCNDQAINLRRYLTEVQKSWSREVAEASLTLQLRIDIAICARRPSCAYPDRQPYVTLVRTLREWRNKIVAHLNYDVALFNGDAFRTRNAWTVSDIRQLIGEAVTIVDRYSFSRGKDIHYTECFEGRADYLLAEEVISKSVRSAGWKSMPST